MWLLTLLVMSSVLRVGKGDEKCGQQELSANLDNEVFVKQPPYPEDHGPNLDCEYKVTAPNNTRIRFRISDFGVQRYGTSFYIWCYNGDSTSSDRFLILSKADQTDKTQYSRNNVMTMKLRVPRSYVYTGFRIAYMAVASCGNRLEAYDNSQSLTSPGFPFKHLANQICLWTIIAPSDHVIEISANQISEEKCCDRVQILDSETILSDGLFYTSTGNTVRIEFVATNSVARNAFELSYRADHFCGERKLTAGSDVDQIFKSPPFRGPSSSSVLSCWYTMTSPEGTRIRFSIDDFGTETFSSSNFYLWIYDGFCSSNERFLILDKASQASTTYYSKTNIMSIQLRAYKPYVYTGFQMTYRAIAACGSRLLATEKTQNISTPGYPLRHSENQVCTWLITAPRGQHIELVVHHVSKELCCQMLEVPEPEAGITRFTMNREYYSFGETIQIMFTSDGSLERDGFLISYRIAPCGGALTAIGLPRNLTSPGYPMSHPSHQTCTWTITSQTNYLIDVTGLFVSKEACCDRVQIEVPTPKTIIQVRTGLAYTTPGNSLKVQFISNNSVERSGFVMQYKAVHVCGIQEFSAETNIEKQIIAPGIPGAYGNNFYCWYTITSPDDTRIRFWVDDFGAGRFHSTYFYMWFYDGLREVGSDRFLVLDQSAQAGVMQHSKSNLLGIKLRAYKPHVYTGFTMRYIAVEACGETLLAIDQQQTITSPVYPAKHSPNLICTWTITSSANFLVEVTSRYVSNETCCVDVQVNVPSPKRVIQLHTGDVYTSPGTSMAIDFSARNSVVRSGFELEIRAVHVCGIQEFNAETDIEKQIIAPGIPGAYGNNFYCWYTITSPDDTRIRFWVDDFGAGRFHSTYFYMWFYDGLREVSSDRFLVLDQSAQAGVVQYSKSNLLGIKLRAYKPHVYTGFTMRYIAVDSCGETLFAIDQQQTITSPGYPAKHSPNLICTWTITSSANFLVEVTSRYVSNETCCDSVQVDVSSPKRVTKMATGQIYTSPGTTMTIDFISTDSIERSGFDLGVRAVHVCGIQEFSAETDSEKKIIAPGIPGAYGNNFYCWYTITSPDDTRIRFWVDDFGAGRFHSSYFYMWFYDGLREVSNDRFLVLDQAAQAGVMQHSKSNLLGIKLRAYKPYVYNGFTMRYVAVDSCGETLLAIDQQQTITSPDYPAKHSSNLICTWTITSSANFLVEVTSRYVSNETCCGNVQANVPSPKTATQLHTGDIYTSPGTTMTIHFIAKDSVKRSGFDLDFRAVHVCGIQEFSAETDIEKKIIAPGIPGAYANNFYCWYTITSPDDTRIRFWVDDFGAGRFHSSYFYMWFYDGLREVSTDRFLVLDKSAQAGVMQHSRSNLLGIKLRAYKPYVYTGFTMRYIAVGSCGETLLAIAESQTITSPGYPEKHSSNEICTWTITSSSNYIMEVTSRYVSNESCCDVVQVDVPSPKRVTRLSTGQEYNSPGTTMTIDFFSTNSIERRGFDLSVKAVHVCGIQEFSAETDIEKQIIAPGIPGAYGNNFYCWYTITSPDDTRIRFWVDEFGAGRFHSSYFYMWFYDGLREVSTDRFLILDKSAQAGVMQHSRSNLLGIKLRAYKPYVYTGFTMRYLAVRSCGATLRAIEEEQIIMSPDYPSQHASNEICTWKITSPSNYVMEITSRYVSNETCCDNVQVDVPTPKRLIRLQTGQLFTSPGPTMTIDFISKESVQRSGFDLLFKAVHVCGVQEYDAEIDMEKLISPPAFPGDYGEYLYCWYTVTSPEDTRIRFWIDDFGTVSFHSSYYYLWFYDGLREITNDRFLILNQASQAGQMQHSKSNLLGIKLRARKAYGYTGFRMRYMAVRSCGKDDLRAINLEQRITSPGFPLEHLSNEICTWSITSASNYVIETTADVVSNETCCDIVQATVPTPSKVTRLRSDQVYTSPGTSLKLDFISINSAQRSGFNLQFRAVHVCGVQEYNAETDLEKLISPPAFPGDYGEYLYCWYTVTSPEDTRIRFWVDDFGTVSFHSSYYYLWFYDGLREIANDRFLILNKASQAGQMQHSKSNLLGIKLRARKAYVYTGFRMRYIAVRSCGEDDLRAINLEQRITSPGFPLEHLSNEICTWSITSASNYVIETTVYYASNETCCDIVQATVPTPSKITRLRSDQVYISPGTSLKIDFISTNSAQKSGFNLQFRAVHVCGVQEYNAETDLEKLISPPAFPGDYGEYLYCWYTVTSPEDTRIRFWIDDFGTVSFHSSYYYLWFYDGLREIANDRFLILNQASQAGQMQHSKSNLLGIKLRSRKAYVYTGFKMRYMAVNSCGKTYRAIPLPQTITSPNYPLQHSSNAICTWDISSSNNHVIEVTPRYVSNETCCDIVQMEVPTPRRITRLRGVQSYTTPGTNTKIDFISINSVQKTGFDLQFKEVHVCGELESSAELNIEKRLLPPGYPGDYGNTLYCSYVVTSPRDTRIRFWIDDFGTATFSSTYYYLHFYDGWPANGVRFLILSQPSQAGTMQHSRSNVMTIKLKASKRFTYTGFSMKYLAVVSCGGVLEATEEPHVVSSPGYPLERPSNLICNWTINTPCDHVVELTVLTLDELNSDRLLVVESASAQVPLTAGQVYRSPGKVIEMDYISNGSLGKNGFQVQYRAADKCGTTNLVAEIGEEEQVIQPGFPRSHGYSLTCWYTVRSPEGTRIRFSFPDFGTNTYSTHFTLTFYDGLDDRSPVFLTLRNRNDENTVRFSSDNVLGIKMTVDRRYIVYSGFIIRFSAFESENRLLVKIREEFENTYQMSGSEEMVKRFLLSEYETVDVSYEIYQQIQQEYNLEPKLVQGGLLPVLSGTKVSIRVDRRWAFVIYMQPNLFAKYHFREASTNDVTLSIFSLIRRESDAIQLVNVTEAALQNFTMFLVRVDFVRTYRVSVSFFTQREYQLTLSGTNDVTLATFEQMRGVAYFVQLFSLDSAAPSTGVSVVIRVDFRQVYNVSVSDVVLARYGFDVDVANDISSDIFPLIRREANSVQLVNVVTRVEPSAYLTVRVDYARIYKAALSSQLINYYDFDPTGTNDVTAAIFNEFRRRATYTQLFAYEPSAPSSTPVTIRIGYRRTYRASLPSDVKRQYMLVDNIINDVSEDIFISIRPTVFSLQLYNVETPVTPSGTLITVRVDFNGIYQLYVSGEVKAKYSLLVNITNELALDLFLELRKEINVVQLVRLERTTPVGKVVTVRVDLDHVYHVYLPDHVIKQYFLIPSITNDVTSSIFVQLTGVANIYQIFRLDSLSPSGVKVTVRVDYTSSYDVYMTQEARRDYKFIIGRTNEISSAPFVTLRTKASIVQLLRVQASATIPRGTLVKIRVDHDFVYDVYLTDDVIAQYFLQVNVTNDVSTEVFAKLQGKASSFRLVSMGGEAPEGEEFTIRVDFNQVYRVTFKDDDASNYPLVAGETNDVTSALFAQIRNDVTRLQLLKVDRPVTCTVRVDSMWVYRVVVTDQVRERYNLMLNVTNDITSAVFTSLKEETNSVQLITEDPIIAPGSGGGATVVTVRVNSSWVYKAALSASAIHDYNLSANETNDIIMAVFFRMRDDADMFQLVEVEKLGDYNCPSNNWTIWFNRDDPSGPCDCETLPELREENPGMICEYPSAFEARLENCMTPYDYTLPNVEASPEIGFRCSNEDGLTCLDYEIRFCCP